MKITPALNWNREDLSADWSVVVWGKDGPVHVKNSDASKVTMHMPVAPPRGGAPVTPVTPDPKPVDPVDPVDPADPVKPVEPIIVKSDAEKAFDK